MLITSKLLNAKNKQINKGLNAINGFAMLQDIKLLIMGKIGNFGSIT